MPFGGLKTTDSRLQSYCKDSGSVTDLDELVTGSDPETAKQKPDNTDYFSPTEEDSVSLEDHLQHKDFTILHELSSQSF